MMVVVVPIEECPCPTAGGDDAAKPGRIIGPILHRLELRLGKGIVIGCMGPGMTFANTKVNQQLSNCFGDHRRAAIGMQSQLLAINSLLAIAFSNELLGQVARLTFGYHPANHIATEDIKNDIQIEELPGDRPSELHDVPGP